MSQSAKDFLENWARDNINAEGYDSEDNELACHLVQVCEEDAQKEGISLPALDAAAADMMIWGDNLLDFMINAVESVNDAEVKRLSGKND